MKSNIKKYDVIVIGGGHAGIEAAYACSKAKLQTLLVSLSINKIGLTPCNPSIGGSAKGIVVREIDAMGGLIGKISDSCTLQLKYLNRSKGYAVRSLRSQIDKIKYPQNALQILTIDNKYLKIIEDKIIELIFNKNIVTGALGFKSGKLWGKCVILTTGTYMSSLILRGSETTKSGPEGQETIFTITKQLQDNFGIKFTRLKTGTPPRLDESTIDYSFCEKVYGDRNNSLTFSFWNKSIKNAMLPCWLTYTNEKTHGLIRKNLKYSSIYTKKNIGKGPRYCPSIEDKITRFADKKRHQLFLEPESQLTNSIYLQGFSTSFPAAIQEDIIKTIPALANVRILNYGYSIEYDCVIPTQLNHSLEFKKIKNLYSAGQINGTSGYEEAAAQGLMAGINVICNIKKEPPFILKRSESYIGVMLSDLIFKKYTEPYRLLSSLSEYRLLLRSDNADIRLSKYGKKYELLSENEIEQVTKKQINIDKIMKIVKTTYIDNSNLIAYLKEKKIIIITKKTLISSLLKQPNITLLEIVKYFPALLKYKAIELENANINIKYEGYIKIQQKEIDRMFKNYQKKIPTNINYSKIKNLSNETMEKLHLYMPKSIAEASLIQGIKAVDLINISYYLKRHYSSD